MVERERPAGVLVIIVLYIILAIIRLSESALWARQGEGLEAMAIFLAPNVILGVMYLILAGGLHLLKRWAWILATVFAVVGLIYAALKLAGVGAVADLIGDLDISTSFFSIPLISLIMNLIVLIYLVHD